MRLEYTDQIFIPCFVHQANLCVTDIFKSSPKYKDASTKAISIVAYFTDKQKKLYRQYYCLVRPVNTCWNSYYFCFSSLTHNKRALKDLLENIAKFLDDNNWWQTVEELKSHLLPFMATLNHLQRDAARLPNLDKVFSMTQMHAKINYKYTIEAAKSLEQNISANINTIFGSYNREYTQTNYDKQESSSILELETNTNNENAKMIDNSESTVLKEWFEGLVFKEESVEELESLFKTEETEETANLSSNELLVGLKHPAEDPTGKWKLANLFDFKFSTLSSIKKLMIIQDNSR
ncbi:14373_t:CDS:2 [Cetraspora pellucida]|uniref:14373_t:CDS:1 n=1 Tax=Cetraspora pellucida TaxID=1433469 RepID=A0A9N9E1D3_9GLOM|nr:14373_t:CDS:2 [Cetraspora pellucida]